MSGRKKKIYFIPLALLALLLGYAFNDVMSSRQAGFSDVSRTMVYILLSLIIAFMGLYNILHGERKLPASALSKSLWAMVVWIVFVNLYNHADLWVSLTHISLAIWWIMSYYFFYNYLRRNPGSKGTILFVFMIMLFFYVLANIFIRNNITANTERKFAITGFAYLFVLIVPFITLIKRKWLRAALLGLVIFMVATSYKRGPMLILPAMFFAYYYSLSKINGKWGGFIKKIFFFSLIIAAAFIIADRASDGFLSARFTRDELMDGSGRSDIWARALHNIKFRDNSELFFGTGSGSSVKMIGNTMHNEWLEFMFSFGIVGVLLYGIICIELIRKTLKALARRSVYAPDLSMLVAFVIIVGVFGCFFFQHYAFYAFAFLGVVEYLFLEEANNKKR